MTSAPLAAPPVPAAPAPRTPREYDPISARTVHLSLLAIGLDTDTVAADYALTQANLAGEWTERMLRKVRRFRVPVSEALLEVLAHSPEPVLRDTLDWVAAEYGGVTGYLASVGVGEDVIARLRARLALEPAASGPEREPGTA